jgi:TRAP-type C4-dicarboxylate transport system permease small subunit
MATTFLIFAQVVNRYFLHLRIMGMGDLALYLFIGFMLVAAAYTTWNEGHIAVDYFRERAFAEKPRAAATHKAVMVLLSIIVACTFLGPAYGFMAQAIKYPQYGTLIRWFNTSWLQTILFVMIVLVLFHLVVIAARDIPNAVKAFRAEDNR